MMSATDPETDIIQELFAPLTLGATGAYGLQDDVAFVKDATSGIIITQDQVIEGTHFYPNDPLDMIAKRLVRRNLSDMIAKGGQPSAAFLSLAWPKSRPKSEMYRFANGLGEDLKELCGGIPLLGGDTSTTQGPLVASLTLLGTPSAPSGEPILRSGAQVGDVIVVTGVIGDAYMARMVREGIFRGTFLQDCIEFGMAPYPPAIEIAHLIGRYANASLDVSDGLLIDALRLARASNIRIDLQLDLIPISKEAEDFPDFDYLDRVDRNIMLATGGDDYQPLMAMTQESFEAFQKQAKAFDVSVTIIGQCVEGNGLALTFDNKPVDMPLSLGWESL
jgi:thiamine-monophosphate kinase